MSYLTAQQCDMILRTPHFSTPLTESWMDYQFYRGQHHASVLTLRFNWTALLSVPTVKQALMERLFFLFYSITTNNSQCEL